MYYEKHYNRKIVKVKEVEMLKSPWGANYSIYKEKMSDVYYIGADDGSDDVMKLSSMFLPEAIREAHSYLNEIFNLM